MLAPVGFGPLKSWAAGTMTVFESAVLLIPQGDTELACVKYKMLGLTVSAAWV